MTEEDFLAIICTGTLILGIIGVIALIVLNMRAFSIQRRKEGGNTCLTIMAKRNLALVRVEAKFGNEEIRFERKRVRKGQSVDFVFPQSEKKVKLVVEDESGSVQTREV